MYSVEITGYGLKMRRSGYPEIESSAELLALYLQKLSEVKTIGRPFGHLVDVRGFTSDLPEIQKMIITIMKSFKEAGGSRSAVILDNPLSAMLIRRLGISSGIDTWVKYLDPETHPDFEKDGIAWIADEIDPDRD
jgi:hypothetical protein